MLFKIPSKAEERRAVRKEFYLYKILRKFGTRNSKISGMRILFLDSIMHNN
jgi:hypothetical protein